MKLVLLLNYVRLSPIIGPATWHKMLALCQAWVAIGFVSSPLPNAIVDAGRGVGNKVSPNGM